MNHIEYELYKAKNDLEPNMLQSICNKFDKMEQTMNQLRKSQTNSNSLSQINRLDSFSQKLEQISNKYNEKKDENNDIVYAIPLKNKFSD